MLAVASKMADEAGNGGNVAALVAAWGRALLWFGAKIQGLTNEEERADGGGARTPLALRTTGGKLLSAGRRYTASCRTKDGLDQIKDP